MPLYMLWISSTSPPAIVARRVASAMKLAFPWLNPCSALSQDRISPWRLGPVVLTVATHVSMDWPVDASIFLACVATAASTELIRFLPFAVNGATAGQRGSGA